MTVIKINTTLGNLNYYVSLSYDYCNIKNVFFNNSEKNYYFFKYIMRVVIVVLYLNIVKP